MSLFQQLSISYLQQISVLIIVTFAILEIISLTSKLIYFLICNKIKKRNKYKN